MRRVLLTEDGSTTLLDDRTGETFHSRHGADQESVHVFLMAGLQHWKKQNPSKSSITLLEIGLGSGLNALLAQQWAEANRFHVYYHVVELYPLQPEEWRGLSFSDIPEGAVIALHTAEWGGAVELSPYFTICKEHRDFATYPLLPKTYEVVFYDAFSPAVEPSLWESSLLQRVAKSLKEGGVLVTYCAKGTVRRAFEAGGLSMERLPGPPGKREMLRGTSPHCATPE